jgi:hypothetical protein
MILMYGKNKIKETKHYSRQWFGVLACTFGNEILNLEKVDTFNDIAAEDLLEGFGVTMPTCETCSMMVEQALEFGAELLTQKVQQELNEEYAKAAKEINANDPAKETTPSGASKDSPAGLRNADDKPEV